MLVDVARVAGGPRVASLFDQRGLSLSGEPCTQTKSHTHNSKWADKKCVFSKTELSFVYVLKRCWLLLPGRAI